MDPPLDANLGRFSGPFAADRTFHSGPKDAKPSEIPHQAVCLMIYQSNPQIQPLRPSIAQNQHDPTEALRTTRHSALWF